MGNLRRSKLLKYNLIQSPLLQFELDKPIKVLIKEYKGRTCVRQTVITKKVRFIRYVPHILYCGVYRKILYKKPLGAYVIIHPKRGN